MGRRGRRRAPVHDPDRGRRRALGLPRARGHPRSWRARRAAAAQPRAAPHVGLPGRPGQRPARDCASRVPLDGFDREAVLLALEARSATTRSRLVRATLRNPPAGEQEEQDADARTCEGAATALRTSGADAARREPASGPRGRSRDRAGGPARHRREPPVHARARATSEGTDDSRCCAGCCWRVTGRQRPARACRRCPAAPGVRGLRGPRARAPSRRRCPSRSSRSCGSPTTTTSRRGRVSAGMVLSIAFFALLVFGYFYVVCKVWRGESELDRDDPAALWPFSLALWRGSGARAPGARPPG